MLHTGTYLTGPDVIFDGGSYSWRHWPAFQLHFSCPKAWKCQDPARTVDSHWNLHAKHYKQSNQTWQSVWHQIMVGALPCPTQSAFSTACIQVIHFMNQDVRRKLVTCIHRLISFWGLIIYISWLYKLVIEKRTRQMSFVGHIIRNDGLENWALTGKIEGKRGKEGNKWIGWPVWMHGLQREVRVSGRWSWFKQLETEICGTPWSPTSPDMALR